MSAVTDYLAQHGVDDHFTVMCEDPDLSAADGRALRAAAMHSFNGNIDKLVDLVMNRASQPRIVDPIEQHIDAVAVNIDLADELPRVATSRPAINSVASIHGHETSPSVGGVEVVPSAPVVPTVGESTDHKRTDPSSSPSVPGSTETPKNYSVLPTTHQAAQS